MALYGYQAYTKDGKKISSTIDASSEEFVRQQLLNQGLFPIAIVRVQSQGFSIPWYKKLFQGSVSAKDKILFTRQLSVLLKAGVPLLQALELISEQFEGRFKGMIIAIKDGIKEGDSFAQGLAQYPKTFDSIYVQLVRAGEASGKLELILDRLVEYMERRASLVKKVKAALTNPIIQLVAVIVVVIALVTFVVPNFAEVFAQQGRELPFSTRFLMNLSQFFINHWLMLLITLTLAVAAFIYWKRSAVGSVIYDRVLLKLPIIGYFTRMGAIVQFSRTLGMLLDSGVNLSEALDIVVKIIDNKTLKTTLSEARDKIIKQGKIAEYLKQTGIFPPIATYLIRTGEESGQLGYMLLVVAQNYEEDLSDYSASLAAKLGPFMLIFMACIVGFIVLAIAQPMMNQIEF